VAGYPVGLLFPGLDAWILPPSGPPAPPRIKRRAAGRLPVRGVSVVVANQGVEPFISLVPRPGQVRGLLVVLDLMLVVADAFVQIDKALIFRI
jgi:hypothetical protein